MKPTLNVDPRAANNWAFMGTVAFVMHTNIDQIAPGRWDNFLKDMGEHKITHVLGGAWGAASVDSVQRSQLVTLLKNVPTAVVVNHPVARGVVTAIGWLGLTIRGFGWDAVPDAVAWLNTPLPPDQLAGAYVEFQNLCIAVVKNKK